MQATTALWFIPIPMQGQLVRVGRVMLQDAAAARQLLRSGPFAGLRDNVRWGLLCMGVWGGWGHQVGGGIFCRQSTECTQRLMVEVEAVLLMNRMRRKCLPECPPER